MKRFCAVALLLSGVTVGVGQTAIIVDHTSISYDSIPSSYLDAARSSLRIGYGHTSHGSQLVSGMEVLRGIGGGKFSYTSTTTGLVPGVFLNDNWPEPTGVRTDLGGYGDVTWAWATRQMLNLSNNDRNVVMWSWCGGVSTNSAAGISAYLNSMDSLEKAYPSVRFVYMTGHLDGTGATGTLNVLNNQIREYCRTKGKILFDFADIESYAPNGTTNYMALNANDNCDYTGGNWASQWIAANPGSSLATLAASCSYCAHSQSLNCILKSAAAWWLFARLAGWSGTNGSPGVGTPTPLAPVDNAVNQPLSLTLRWRAVAGATQYHVQMGRDGSFGSGLLVNDSTLTDTVRAVSGLSNSDLYYWRVRAKNAGGSSSYSEGWQFQTVASTPSVPDTPVLLLPPADAVNQPLSLTLRWRAVAGATQYHVQMGRDGSFGSGLLVNDSTLTDTVRAVSGLSNSDLYYWRVRAKNAGGSSSYSEGWQFQTVASTPSVPDTPVLLLPPADAVNQPLSLTLRWRAVAGATQYHVQMGRDGSFGSGLLVNDSTLTDTVRAVSGLSNGDLYYWRVRAKNAGGSSSYSEGWQFQTVASTPGTPVLLLPTLGAIEQQTSPLVLSWRKVVGASSYELQVATDSVFASGIVRHDTTIADTVRSVSSLAQNMQYFWRVASRNGSGTGPFSPAWTFRTISPTVGAATLISPADLGVVGADSVRFRWSNPTPGATRYWFEVATDSLFTKLVVWDSSVTDTAKVIKPLTKNASYYWHVWSGTATKWGTMSNVGRFTVSVTSVLDTRAAPDDLTLLQNYPNPFNPATEISFGVPKESRVRIEVYNLLGQQVATVLDGIRSAGYHSIRFDAGNLTSGLYLYRMIVGETALLRKMVLLK